MLCIVKRVILKKSTFQSKHRKIFQTNELNQLPMLKALIKIGGQMLEGSSPPTPVVAPLMSFMVISFTTNRALVMTRARFVVKPGGVSTEFLTKLDGVNYNLGLKKPWGGVTHPSPDKSRALGS